MVEEEAGGGGVVGGCCCCCDAAAGGGGEHLIAVAVARWAVADATVAMIDGRPPLTPPALPSPAASPP